MTYKGCNSGYESSSFKKIFDFSLGGDGYIYALALAGIVSITWPVVSGVFSRDKSGLESEVNKEQPAMIETLEEGK